VSGYILAQDTTLYFQRSALPSLISLPDSTTQCELHLQGKGHVYAVSLETPTGVIVDNIPMRGCSGNIFTRIDSVQLRDFYRDTNTRLIILQFGGNMIPQTENPSTISGYVRSTLRQQVRYIRACAPQASILFIGPSDMSTRIDGEMTTYPLVPYMDRLLRKMAAEEQIAYWSMYDAMGGKDSMVRWVENGLAGSDYVHFTRSGANNIGKKLYNWLMSYSTSDRSQSSL
jgi:lysophospholipase L1-like esterase